MSDRTTAAESPVAAPISARNVIGAMWMIAAMVTLTIMFAILKQVTLTLPVMVAALFRTAVSFALMLPWLMRGGPGLIRTERFGGHFLRSFYGIASFVCFTYAISQLFLADVVLLSFTLPFWTILIMALLGRERIQMRRLAATGVGFLGVLMIVRPQSQIEPAAILGVMAALLASLAMIQMKALTSTEPPTRIVFYFFLFGSLMLVPGAIWQWRTPNQAEFLWLLGTGVSGALGQIFLARAYEAAEVGVIAPLDFIRLPVAAVIGFFAFGELPGFWTWAGTAVILSSIFYITYRERQLGRPAKPVDHAIGG